MANVQDSDIVVGSNACRAITFTWERYEYPYSLFYELNITTSVLE